MEDERLRVRAVVWHFCRTRKNTTLLDGRLRRRGCPVTCQTFNASVTTSIHLATRFKDEPDWNHSTARYPCPMLHGVCVICGLFSSSSSFLALLLPWRKPTAVHH